MTTPADPRDCGFMSDWPLARQWAVLVGGSVVLGAMLEIMHLPAALLLGPMVAGIAVATNGGSIRPPMPPVRLAQAIVGCLVARAITGDIVFAFLKDWPLFLGVVLVMVATGSALGWGMARYAIIPGTTALWGTSPGAASVMFLMADAFGADARLVAFMQYFRVVCVAALASLVARIWLGPEAVAGPQASWFPPLAWWDFAATIAIAGVGVAANRWRALPGATMLVPMVLGAVVESSGLAHLTLPPWLLVVAYAFLGWSVGLGFTRAILKHAQRAFPQVFLSTMITIAVAGVLALILVKVAGVDPLSAYLATTPGGMDTVAIIAASSTADVSFVMALQVVRLVIVLFTGPPLARLIAQRVGG